MTAPNLPSRHNAWRDEQAWTRSLWAGAVGGGWAAVVFSGYGSDLAWALRGLALEHIAEAAVEAGAVFLFGAGLGALLGACTLNGVVRPLLSIWAKRGRDAAR